MPNYRRCFQPGQIVFITLVTARRRPWMSRQEVMPHVLEAMSRLRAFHPFRNVAHVLLPDHLHWLLAPAATTSVPKLVASFKRDLSLHRGPIGAGEPLWQARYYDHIIRDRQDLERHLDYIHHNPTRHGYVSRPADYPWSSLAEWVRRGHYAPDWGCVMPQGIDGMELE
jgi:putative transposase